MTENNRKQQNTSVSERDYDDTNRAAQGNESETAYSQGGGYNDETDQQDAGDRQPRYRRRENYSNTGNSSPDSYGPGNRNYGGRNYDRGMNREWREWDDPNSNPNSNFGIQGSAYPGRTNQERDYTGGSQWNSGYGGSQYNSRINEDQLSGNRRYQSMNESNPQWRTRYGQSDSQQGVGRYPQYGNTDYGQRTPQYGNYSESQYNGQRGSSYNNSAYEQDRNQYDNSNFGQGGLQGRNSGSRYNDTNYGQGTLQYGAGRNQGNSQQEAWHKGKGPKGYRRSDERIKEDINDRLTDDTQLDASDIEVAVTNGEVKLTGTVETREAKRRAEDLAEMISGISNVENSLRVTKEKSTHSNKDTAMGSNSSSSSTLSNGHDNKNKKAGSLS